MVDKAELLALAERVEGLSGANFAIEQQIGAEVFGPQPYLFPAFTASLDAAMGLVPSGWWLFHICARPNGGFLASIYNDQSIYAASGRAATPALALTAAALRARAEGVA